MNCPVSLTLARELRHRNRLTTAFRPILALPHAILVGPIYWWFRTGTVGLLGAVAYFLAIVSWFTLVFAGKHLRGIQELSLFYPHLAGPSGRLHVPLGGSLSSLRGGPVRPDTQEMTVVLRQPRIDFELLRKLTAFRHCPVVVRTGDVRRARNNADLVFQRRGWIRNENVTVLRPVRFHVVLLMFLFPVAQSTIHASAQSPES